MKTEMIGSGIVHWSICISVSKQQRGTAVKNDVSASRKISTNESPAY